MDKNKKIILGVLGVLGLIAIAVYIFLGPTPGTPQTNIPTGPVTLKMWKPFVDSEQMNQLIAAYQQKHPQVRIEYVKKNIENYEEDLLNSLAAGEGPDIFTIHNAWLPKYVDKIQAAPEKTFTFTDYKNTFLDVITEDFTQDNKIYGTALSVDTLGLYYNKDLLGTAGFATPPKTWDELARQTRSITRQNERGYFTISGVPLGTSSNINRSQDILYLFMLQQGVKPYSKDRSRPAFASAVDRNGNSVYPGALGLTFYTSFADPNSSNYTWNTESDYSIDSFANGRSAFVYGYSYLADTLRQKSPNLNFDVATVPQVSLDQARVNFANYFGEVVNKQSKNGEVAWDFLKFITSKEILDKYSQAYKEPSSRKDIIEAQVADPKIGIFAHAALTAKAFYRPDQARFDSIINRAIDGVTLGGMKPEAAIRQAEQQASTIGRGNY